MNERSVAFYVALSHSLWGVVPVVALVGLGILIHFAMRHWRDYKQRPILLALLVLWPLLLESAWLSLAGLFHFGCSARVSASVQCNQELKRLGQAALEYAQEHDETLPPADRWEVVLLPYLKKLPQCPHAHTGTGYTMNSALSNKKLEVVEAPSLTVLFFDTDLKRHGKAPNLLFVDGHVQYASAGYQKTLIWTLTPDL